MTAPKLAAAVRTAVAAWEQATTSDQRREDLSLPAELSARLAKMVESELVQAGVDSAAVLQEVLSAPYVHLPGVFESVGLPETPDWFFPVPEANGSITGRAAALAVHSFLRKETVSYGSENNGELFVNLVPIAGDGKFGRKSKDGLRGHTDAVSFPFNGESDASEPRIAPSPDLVTLVGLRNPNSVPTTVIVLKDVLAKLSPQDIAELKKGQYSFGSQATFIEGMRNILGGVHTAIDEPVLKDTEPGTIVRYSHSSVMPTELGGAAQTASENFEAACNEVAVSIAIAPGDVLLVSNRLCLHGRGFVGGDVGGESRWLLRTYGLDTSDLDESRRHLGDHPRHVLFP